MSVLQIKALKKTKKYKSLLEQGVKVVFKPKKLKNKKILTDELDENGKSVEIDSELDEINSNVTDFKTILGSIVNDQKDPFLFQAYELIVNGEKIEMDDILFL